MASKTITFNRYSEGDIGDKPISRLKHNNVTYEIVDDQARADILTKQDALPSQSGNSGKFLTTNGTTMSWATVSSGGKFLTFTNIYVDAMYWTHDNTYADYPYSATITCQGVTSSDFAYVVFAPGDFDSGIYANVCLTGTDTVTIYGKSDVYDASYQGVTIPTIVVIGA